MSSSAPEAKALALLQAGRLEEAEAAWRAILAERPDDADALHFLGCVLARAGRTQDGLDLIDRSLRQAPRNPAFLNNRARVLADAGRLEEAVADLRRAVQGDPRFAAAFLHLGTLLGRLGRGEEALAALRRAAALDPGQPGAHAALGRLLFGARDFAGARACFERALALLPGDPDLLNNLGLALQAEGAMDAALARYREALGRRPRFPEALLNLGNALRETGDLAAAGEMYRKALAERPDFVEALVNAASAAADVGDLGAARSLFERALAIAPGSADARYGLGVVALRERRWAEGWDGYERRFATRPPQASWRELPLSSLAPGDLDRVRRVAVWSEQGIGDQILFATLLPELARRGIGAVVEVDPRLREAFRRSLPGMDFVGKPAPDSAFAGCDAQLPLGSLPALFRRGADDFARQPRALLEPDRARVDEMRSRLGPGRWIGIAWRSLQKGERRAMAERKSIPLEAFGAFSRAPGVRLLDLQYGDVGEERARFHARYPGLLTRLEGLDPWSDLEGMLAAIAACERVVTSSNVTAHLAGAIGAPATVVFLHGWPPFHYWVPDEAGRSPWYPSVEVAGERSWASWDEALGALAARL